LNPMVRTMHQSSASNAAGREPSRPSLLSRAGERWLAPGGASPAVEKLRSKLAHNLHLGFRGVLRKGFRFATASAFSRLLLRDVDQVGVGVRVVGLAPIVDNTGGTIVLGDDVIFDAPRLAIHFVLEPGARLSIGAESWLNDGVWLGCTERITIGERVLIGPGVRILDNNYHDLYQRRLLPAARPITIDSDVWIGADAIILPGVSVGRGAVIGAHAVVLDDVPPLAVVAGNPARVVKTLDPGRFELASSPRGRAAPRGP